MSADPVVLGILSDVCDGNELHMFERIHLVTGGREPVPCFLCLGKQAIFFVSKDMSKLVEGKTLSYLHIQKAVVDSSTKTFYLLRLSDDKDSYWSSDILIKSFFRDQTLGRIALSWQAATMFYNYQVEKFPMARSAFGKQMTSTVSTDHLQVEPFKGYEEGFKHRGYSFFLRQGFISSSGLKQGTFVHPTGWVVEGYNGQRREVPPGVQITVHAKDPIPAMELENSGSGSDDIRTIATQYRQLNVECLDQFYVMVNNPYQKKMNRTNDIASWDGWEFFVRSKDYIFICIILRREYIPPLCDLVQDLALVLRCPAENMKFDHCEILLDELRYVADTISPTAECRQPYREIIQARLDTLQCSGDAYLWLEGNLGLTPVHRKSSALKFLKSIIQIMISEVGMNDDTILDVDVFRGVPVLHNPLLVAQELLGDVAGLLEKLPDRAERRNAWYCRISRYLAFCVDGGLLGERFVLGDLVRQIGIGGYETDKKLKAVVNFLLHILPIDGKGSSQRVPLSQLLQTPSDFGKHHFNERVMRVLLIENYLQAEWSKRKNSTSVNSYEKLLATMLVSESCSIGFRTLICRQILETTNQPAQDKNADDSNKKVQVLIPALINVMQRGNLSLASCATAALVNLSCGRADTKTILVQQGCIKICANQLIVKDEDLTLYTLYLLVNLTKTPHHRAIVVRSGCLALLVDILTSSYQNLRVKSKVLTEIASVLGQLCNDKISRHALSEDFPVMPCLLWIFDAAPPNTKLKSKIVFALRQFSVLPSNKIKVGQHAIPRLIEELGAATPTMEECATNAVLLLTMLTPIHSNALMMNAKQRLANALSKAGIPTSVAEATKAPSCKWNPHLGEKVAVLLARIVQGITDSG